MHCVSLMGCSTAMEEIKPLVADGMDTCQDRFTTLVISLETDDNNMTYEGKIIYPFKLLFSQIMNIIIAVFKVLK